MAADRVWKWYAEYDAVAIPMMPTAPLGRLRRAACVGENPRLYSISSGDTHFKRSMIGSEYLPGYNCGLKRADCRVRDVDCCIHDKHHPRP